MVEFNFSRNKDHYICFTRLALIYFNIEIIDYREKEYSLVMKSTEKSASFKASCPDKHYLAHLFSSCELFMHGSLLKQSLQTAAFIRLLPSVLLRNMSLPLVDNTLLLGGNLCKRGKNPLASNCTIYSRKLVYMKRKNTLKCLFRGKKKM